MQQLSEDCGDREMVVRCHAYRLREHLELGDIDGVDRELAEFARLAQELRMPQHIWHIYALRSTRAMIDGDLEEAERLAEESRAKGERAEQPLAAQYYGIQLTQVRRFQGRTGELEPAVKELAERYPLIPAWRTALISLHAIGGNVDEGRIELERFVGEDFSVIARDAVWVTALGLLGEATALLGDSERSQIIYDELLPYEGLVIVAARAAANNGPVDRILGLLAATTGRTDDAIRHFEGSIELSTRMGDRPYLALGRANLADALLERDNRGDRERALELLGEALSSARELGARFVADQALASRLEAQGLAGVDVTTSIDEMVSELESERPDMRAHAAPDGTVAILFSDIEDSTLLTERLGDERWLEVLREHNAIFREQLQRHEGYEVKSQGDGFMLAFPDPCEALECAVGVQRAFAERERDEDREKLRVRMGLHKGEVIAEEGDFFGKNVILAARIAAQAGGGEILVSEEMRRAAGTGNGFNFDEGRELELKGLAGSHRVFRAEWEPETAAA
jgi:eukaryotic-like serine/threonine-protein kinase